jgi:ribosome modulation factor
MTNGERAEAKGYQAGKLGKSSKTNPHALTEGVFHRWNAGWEQGRAELRGINKAVTVLSRAQKWCNE